MNSSYRWVKVDWIRALLEYGSSAGHKTTCPMNLSNMVEGNECECGWVKLIQAVEQVQKNG